MNSYESFCSEVHFSQYPVSTNTIAAFLLNRTDKLGGSTKSLQGTISQLKLGTLHRGHAWLDPASLSNLKHLVHDLVMDDDVPTVQVPPICQLELDKLLPLIDSTNRDELSTYIAMRVGHDLLLRANELLKLTAENLTWHSTHVTVAIIKSKRNKTCKAEYLELYDTGRGSTFHLLSQWCQINRAAYLFSDSGQPLNTFQFSIKLRSLLRRVVSNTNLYSGHSLRAGGATDLFNSGMLYASIKTLGRWKSDAALLYFRDQSISMKAALLFRRSHYAHIEAYKGGVKKKGSGKGGV